MKKYLESSTLHTIFFVCVTGALSLGQLQKIPLPLGSALYLHDILIGAWLLITGLVAHSTTLPWKKLVSSPTGALGIWILFMTIITAVSTQQVLPLLYMARIGTYSMLLVLLAHTKVLKPEILAKGVVSTGLLWAVFGVIQFLAVPDLRLLRWIGFDDHYYRLTSTFLDPNFAGIALVLTYLYLQLFVYQKKILLSWWHNLSLSLLLFGSIAATYSRASYLSTGVISLLLLLQKKLPKKLLLTTYAIGVLFAFCVWLLLPKPGGEGVTLARTASITARIETSLLEIATLSPTEWVWGHGAYTRAPSRQEYQGVLVPNHSRVPSNFFVFLLTSGGVVGLALGILALFEWYQRLLGWHPLAPALLIALTLHAQFNNSFFEPTLFLFVGLGLVALREPATKQR